MHTSLAAVCRYVSPGLSKVNSPLFVRPWASPRKLSWFGIWCCHEIDRCRLKVPRLRCLEVQSILMQRLVHAQPLRSSPLPNCMVEALMHRRRTGFLWPARFVWQSRASKDKQKLRWKSRDGMFWKKVSPLISWNSGLLLQWPKLSVHTDLDTLVLRKPSKM